MWVKCELLCIPFFLKNHKILPHKFSPLRVFHFPGFKISEVLAQFFWFLMTGLQTTSKYSMSIHFFFMVLKNKIFHKNFALDSLLAFLCFPAVLKLLLWWSDSCCRRPWSTLRRPTPSTTGRSTWHGTDPKRTGCRKPRTFSASSRPCWREIHPRRSWSRVTLGWAVGSAAEPAVLSCLRAEPAVPWLPTGIYYVL